MIALTVAVALAVIVAANWPPTPPTGAVPV